MDRKEAYEHVLDKRAGWEQFDYLYQYGNTIYCNLSPEEAFYFCGMCLNLRIACKSGNSAALSMYFCC